MKFKQWKTKAYYWKCPRCRTFIEDTHKKVLWLKVKIHNLKHGLFDKNIPVSKSRPFFMAPWTR